MFFSVTVLQHFFSSVNRACEVQHSNFPGSDGRHTCHVDTIGLVKMHRLRGITFLNFANKSRHNFKNMNFISKIEYILLCTDNENAIIPK